jgi:hypothetical protein
MQFLAFHAERINHFGGGTTRAHAAISGAQGDFFVDWQGVRHKCSRDWGLIFISDDKTGIDFIWGGTPRWIFRPEERIPFEARWRPDPDQFGSLEEQALTRAATDWFKVNLESRITALGRVTKDYRERVYSLPCVTKTELQMFEGIEKTTFVVWYRPPGRMFARRQWRCSMSPLLDREYLRSMDPDVAKKLDKREDILRRGGVKVGSRRDSYGYYSASDDAGIEVTEVFYTMPDGSRESISYNTGRS